MINNIQQIMGNNETPAIANPLSSFIFPLSSFVFLSSFIFHISSLSLTPLHQRTRFFATQAIRFYSSLPKTTTAQVIGKQFLRSGTSVGAHMHESKRSRSNAEMISKTEVALQELEETTYWLQLLIDNDITKPDIPNALITEANELISIMVTGVKTLKSRTAK